MSSRSFTSFAIEIELKKKKLVGASEKEKAQVFLCMRAHTFWSRTAGLHVYTIALNINSHVHF